MRYLASQSRSLIASKAITPALKEIVGRERPNGGDRSFPSNDATQALAVASVIAEHYDRPWIDATAYALAGAVGWARVRHDAHCFSDVVAGAAIGTAVGKLVVCTNDRERDGGSCQPRGGWGVRF